MESKLNVLLIGHDISYVRFFATLEANSPKDIHFTHVYFRPSAWIYATLLLKLNAKTPAIGRLLGYRYVDNSIQVTLDTKFYCKYLSTLNEGNFHQLFNYYYNYFCQILLKTKFDVAIIPGEYRIFEQALLKALNSQKTFTEHLYMEAGPSGYIYFDKVGVNANASFSKTGRNDLLKPKIKAVESKFVAPIPSLSSLLRNTLLSIDILWMVLAKLSSGLLDLSEYWDAFFNRLKISLKKNVKPTVSQLIVGGTKNIIFLGQVRSDVNHTHFGIELNQIKQSLIRFLDADPSSTLIMRDHPLEQMSDIYCALESIYPGRVKRDSSQKKLDILLKKSAGVITVNSNGGLEALKFGLPVLLLGKSYYINVRGATSNIDDFINLVNNNSRRDLNGASGVDVNSFLENCFIPIDYRAGDFSNIDYASDILLSLKNE